MDDTQRRTCPLTDCEKCFVDEETMLGHVYQCERLRKGNYRCSSCLKQDRISRCQTHYCIDPYQRKERLSVRWAKRLFPSHGSKRSDVMQEEYFGEDVFPATNIELDAAPVVSELAANSTDGFLRLDSHSYNPEPTYIQELHGGLPAELGCNGQYLQDASTSMQPTPVELGTYHDCTNLGYGNQHFNSLWAESCAVNTVCANEVPLRERFFASPPHANNSGTTSTLRVQIPEHNKIDYNSLPGDAPVIASSPSSCNLTRSSDSMGPARGLLHSYLETAAVSPAQIYASPLSNLSPLTPLYSQQSFELDMYPQSLNKLADRTYSGSFSHEALPTGSILPSSTLATSDFSFRGGNADNQYLPIEAAIGHHDWYYDHLNRETVSLTSTTPSLASSPTDSSPAYDSPPKYRCDNCEYEPKPSGKDSDKKKNLSRHKNTCYRQLSPYTRREKPFRCTYPGCTGRFTRLDNLRQHRRNQSHPEVLKLDVEVFSAIEHRQKSRIELDKDQHRSVWDIDQKYRRGSTP